MAPGGRSIDGGGRRLTRPDGRPRVAVDLRALVGRPAGIGSYTLELLRELSPSGAAGYVGMAHAPVSAAEELAAAGVEVESHRAPLGVLWQQLVLPRRIARGDVDLLWSPLNTLPARLPVPGVVTVHDLTAILYPESHTLKVRWSILPFFTRTLESAHTVVADSLSTADDLRFHFPDRARRLRVVHPGVGAEFRPAEEEEIAETRAEIGAPDGFILYVGTLEPRKNVRLLVDVWEALRLDDRRATPPLVLAGGSGWHSRDLLRRIRRLEPLGLSYLGHAPRDRLVRIFQAATAFAYPSFYEGFGLPPLEAMACGVPAVVSNRSSLPEVAGDAALQVDPDDPDDLARALRRLLSEPGLARELGERGVERAAGFTWIRAAEQMEEIFLRAAGGTLR